MDTISRENNSSNYLPVAGVIVGLLALVLSAVALVKVSGLKTLSDKIDTATNTANSAAASAQNAASAADKAENDLKILHDSTQDGFTQVGGELGNIKGAIAKLEESAKPAPKMAKAPKGAPDGSAPGTVSAEGTYTIKSGDSLAKIARANGVSLADIEAANPGVDPRHLKIGQKINLPAKK